MQNISSENSKQQLIKNIPVEFFLKFNLFDAFLRNSIIKGVDQLLSIF